MVSMLADPGTAGRDYSDPQQTAIRRKSGAARDGVRRRPYDRFDLSPATTCCCRRCGGRQDRDEALIAATYTTERTRRTIASHAAVHGSLLGRSRHLLRRRSFGRDRGRADLPSGRLSDTDDPFASFRF